jgi:hypothetical protein
MPYFAKIASAAHRCDCLSLGFCAKFGQLIWLIYRDSLRIRARLLPKGANRILQVVMIRAGFLDPESRRDLIELATARLRIAWLGAPTRWCYSTKA